MLGDLHQGQSSATSEYRAGESGCCQLSGVVSWRAISPADDLLHLLYAGQLALFKCIVMA